MDGVTIGCLSDANDIDAYIALQRRTWANTEDPEAWRERMDLENTRVVRDGGRVCGGMVLIPMGQFFGGRSVPMTGIGAVAIDPPERASGLASELMRSVVRELHTTGAALSVLYPATQPVYRRVGYELAGSHPGYSIDTDKIDLRERELAVERFTPNDLDLIRPIYEARAKRTSGNLDRSEKFWERIVPPETKDVHQYVVSGDEGPEGYCVFTQDRKPGNWPYQLNMRDLVAVTPRAARRLLTFFADHRSMADEVRWIGAPADPLIFHLREQRLAVGPRPISWWMIRIVDVQRALSERGYPSGLEAELHLEVRDDILDANNGRFVLEVAGGKGATRTGGDGRVKIDVRGLASLYSGFLGAEELRATGYIDGEDADLATATAIFAGPTPWLADFF